MLSPAVTSPFDPSSKKPCVGFPPIGVRFTVTVSPVDAGFVPGVTATFSSVVPPAATELGSAVPTPVGDVLPLPHTFAAVALFLAAAVGLYGILAKRKWSRLYAMIMFAVLAAMSASMLASYLDDERRAHLIVPTAVRIVLEVMIVLYFAFSRRVRQTLVN